jgi:hypothetical protein
MARFGWRLQPRSRAYVSPLPGPAVPEFPRLIGCRAAH